MSPNTTPSATRDIGSNLAPSDAPRDFTDANDWLAEEDEFTKTLTRPSDFRRKRPARVASEAHTPGPHTTSGMRVICATAAR